MDRAWAKIEDSRYLPLAEHGTDVAAVMSALLDCGWLRRLEGCAGRSLSADEREALVALAFLHDMGKANRGFWRRQYKDTKRIGHTKVVLTLWEMDDSADRLPLLQALGERLGADLLSAMLAHHGAPVGALTTVTTEDTWIWTAGAEYDPIDELATLLVIAAERFPTAFDRTLPTVSLAPRAMSLYAGLLTLADWLGSNPERFRIDDVAGDERRARSRRVAEELVHGLGLDSGRRLRYATSRKSFADVFDVPSPYETQAVAGKDGLGSVVVLEAETGSGKTEAAIWRFLRLFERGEVDGLYFALPTRTSAVQLHGRVQEALDRAFGKGSVSAVLAVPGYVRAGHEDSIGRAERFVTLWPDREQDVLEDTRWAAETSKRYLSARVAVGTVDQAMLSGLCVRHAHLRAAVLSRSLLVVDEVHASDTYMSAVLAHVVENHRLSGGHAMLMSATLGSTARSSLLNGPSSIPPPLEESLDVPYPTVHGTNVKARKLATDARKKSVKVELAPLIGSPGKIAERALASAKNGARVLIVRNTVTDAVATLNALEALPGSDSVLFEVGEASTSSRGRTGTVSTLHHGRFSPEDRLLLDVAVESVIGKRRKPRGGLVVIGTQTLEMSLDLDADLLMTDLVPMDVLLQRLGRLHRHLRKSRPEGHDEPRAIVLTPVERNLTPFTGKLPAGTRHGLGPSNEAGTGIYANLESVEATWRLLAEHEIIDVPYDNRHLVERSTHPTCLEAISEEMGWQRSAMAREGAAIYDSGLARRHTLRLDRPFSTLEPFSSHEGVPRTRLGANDWRVELDEPFDGPFGRPVGVLRIPGWMAMDLSLKDDVAVTPDGERTRIAIADKRFVYDRKGLRADG